MEPVIMGVTHQTQPQYNVLWEKKVEVLVKEQHGRANQSGVQVIQLVLRHVRHLQQYTMISSMNRGNSVRC
jgi:hypothetical protein